jgi:formate dehydrogenase subunit delta
MANDIGMFFNAEPDKAEAARSVANHVRRFWDPRMRREIVTHYKKGGAGLDELPRSAIGLLAQE